MKCNMPAVYSHDWLHRMWLLALLAGIGPLEVATSATAQQDSAHDLRQGRTFIQTRVYTFEEDQAILKQFQGLRVADVSDGMDRAALKNTTERKL